MGRRPLPDPGRPAAALPDRAHRAVRRRLAADALRGRRRDRLRHRALLLAVDHHEQLPAAARAGAGRRLAADLLRPAVPPRRAQAAAARRSPRPRSPGRSRRPGRSATRSSTRSTAQRRRRRRPRLRPAHPDAGHRRHARLPARGRAAVPRVRREHARRRQPAAGGAHRADGEAVRLPARAGPRPPRQPARRPDDLPDQRRAVRPQARPVARRRHDGPAADRRHRHDLERDRRVPVAPGAGPRPTASGWSPSPRCCRPRWRSSSGPTRRSRWPGW